LRKRRDGFAGHQRTGYDGAGYFGIAFGYYNRMFGNPAMGDADRNG
jgi:hypothetical protein